MTLFTFLLQVFVISLSGVLAPGPVTAATIAAGSKKPSAGSLIAIGHCLIELPVMLLILLGLDKILKSEKTQIIIGFAGSLVLLIMALQLFVSIKNLTNNKSEKCKELSPIMTGIVLSLSNPYFLIWWATVGLNIAIPARDLGIWAFVLFALVHWFCDCLRQQKISFTSYKGFSMTTHKFQKILLCICALTMIFFAGKFFYHSVSLFLT